MSDVPGIGHNAPPEPIDPAERYRAIDPERLCIIGAEEVAPLLDVQFPDLRRRAEEFWTTNAAWREAHRNGVVPVADEAENAALADRMKQQRDFAGDDGEVDSVRKRVKLVPWQVERAIDAWFKALTTPVLDAIGSAKAPAVGTMQYAQTQYLLAQAAQERAERERVAREAQERAERLAAEARALAERGASDDAVDAVTEAAMEAEAHATEVSIMAAAPTQSLGVTRTAIGTRSGLTGTWDFSLTDIKALCRAVADGTAPVTFVTTNDQAIRLAIRAKSAPMRECPGLTIAQTFAARRT